ncbi:hypothetical protein D3C84_925640 [compost metagenome]
MDAVLHGSHGVELAKDVFHLGRHLAADHPVADAFKVLELGIDLRDIGRRDVPGHGHLELGGLLVLAVGLEVFISRHLALDADQAYRLDERHLEGQPWFNHPDQRPVAQQHAALGFVDRVPTAKEYA